MYNDKLLSISAVSSLIKLWLYRFDKTQKLDHITIHNITEFSLFNLMNFITYVNAINITSSHSNSTIYFNLSKDSIQTTRV